MNKNIELYSNPDIVYKKAKKLFGDDIELYISTLFLYSGFPSRI